MIYITQRLILAVVTVVGMSLLTFVITRILPGDPARIAAGVDATAEVVERVRIELGLDRPYHEQYFRHLAALMRGDFGESFMTRRPVRRDLIAFLPATFELALFAMAATVAVSIPGGIVAAVYRGRFVDGLTRFLATAGAAIPVFWLGLMLQFVLYAKLGWLPAGSRLHPSIPPPGRVTGMVTVDALLAGDLSTFVNALEHLMLPVTALSLPGIAILSRMTRASMLEVLGQDYVRTARAKGLAELKVLFSHALKNAGLPILTMVGLRFGWLLGGTVLVETIFQWPGLGQYAVDSIVHLDFNSVIGVTIVISIAYLVINLVVDLAYSWLDPRIRY